MRFPSARVEQPEGVFHRGAFKTSATKTGRWQTQQQMGQTVEVVFPNTMKTDHDDGREFVRTLQVGAHQGRHHQDHGDEGDHAGPLPALEGQEHVRPSARSRRRAGKCEDRWKGERLDVIGELLGHGEKSQMTRRYAHSWADTMSERLMGSPGSSR